MIIGFTGTRKGMTTSQKDSLKKLLLYLKCKEFHHGDCVGSDSEAHDIVKSLGGIKIVIHPPKKDSLRAFKNCDIILPAKDYLSRNRDIVNQSDITIGTPSANSESGGGTWYTLKFSCKKNKPTKIIYPSGYTINY